MKVGLVLIEVNKLVTNKLDYQIMLNMNKKVETKALSQHDVSKSFYCQSEIETDNKCDSQCEHCKEYYKPLEQ